MSLWRSRQVWGRVWGPRLGYAIYDTEWITGLFGYKSRHANSTMRNYFGKLKTIDENDRILT
jgi:hypothetical protein